MKIIKESADRIVFKDSNLGGFVVGIVFMSIGLFILYRMQILVAVAELERAILPGIFALVGLFVLLLSKITTFTFDKGLGVLSILKVGILGRREISYKLAKINEVELRKEFRMERKSMGKGTIVSTPTLKYQLVLVFSDGVELPLGRMNGMTINSFSSSLLMGGKGKAKYFGEKIGAFLNIPFKEIGPEVKSTIGLPPFR